MPQCSLLHSGVITLSTAIVVGIFTFYTTGYNDRWRCQSVQQELEAEHPTKLALGVSSDSCCADETADGNERASLADADGIAFRDGSCHGDPSTDGAIRKREQADEQLDLVVLEPGQHVGPYRLQEHLGYLGHRPVHDYDPAFHPYETKRVGYHARGMLSAPPHTSTPPVLRPRPGQASDKPGKEGVEGMILKGGKEPNAGEGSYRLKRCFEGGSHGEVWRGVRLGPDGEPIASEEGYILKRMLLEKGQHVLQAGIREIYFGELLAGPRGSSRVARYVEHLYLFGNYGRGRFGRTGEREARSGEEWEAGAVPTEMWLVFRDEGMSLRHYLYTERLADGFVLHGQSNLWRDMRLDPKGPEVMKSILRQTLEGARFLHERGILHRDLKPSNLIVSLAPTSTTPTDANADSDPAEDASESSPISASPVKAEWGRSRAGGRWPKGSGDSESQQRSSSSKGSPPVLLRIADFSSAVDQHAIAAGLYGATGPAQDGEETLQYAPPEVLFDPEAAYSAERPESYDVWSIGVILLELILGTPEVFTINQRTRAILDRDLASKDEAVRAKVHLLAAMADMCIYSRSRIHPGERGNGARPRRGGAHAESESPEKAAGHREGLHWLLGDRAVVDERCTLADLGKAVHTRDPLDVGFPDQWGLDLLWRLLRWDPLERISIADALKHAYFTGPYRSRRDGSAHPTRSEVMAYDGWYTGSKNIHPAAIALRPRPRYAVLWGSMGDRDEDIFDEDSSSLGQKKRPSGKLVPAPRRSSSGVTEGLFTLNHRHTLDLQYTCPKCNRTFELWESCQNHVTGRHHASFCHYDTTSLPPCLSSHSMLPFDPHSGWCDVQGRRSRIEDFHSIVFQEDYKFYGVFDGHCGTLAAKFASRALHRNLELSLNGASLSYHDEREHVDRNARIERAVREAFRRTQTDFLQVALKRQQHSSEGPSGDSACITPAGTVVRVDGGRIETVQPSTGLSPEGKAPAAVVAKAVAEDDSGTTATVALVYPDVTVVAHVGDSRAVMCCDDSGRAVEITEDHTPYSAGERARVEASGGSVENRGVLRVNGELAVTRTLGNRRLSHDRVLSSEPDVVFLSHPSGAGAHTSGTSRRESGSAFLVLASDGLWDVVSSQEAVDMVKEVIRGASPGYPPGGVAVPSPAGVRRVVEKREHNDARSRDAVARSYGMYGPEQAFQVAATALTHEAYVRGSTDNIGVCVVDLRPH